MKRAPLAAIAALLALALAGCAYDYLQHSDRVAYSAGDAVKSNIAIQTTNPSKKSMYNTTGLGQDSAMFSVELSQAAQ